MSTLRERRRRQTALELQETAIRLALAQGLDAVTTDMIAAEAGVSPRTFFNYFTNKEAAVVGEAPDFPREAVVRFVAGDGSLSEDLHALMATHLARIELAPDALRGLLGLARDHHKVRRAHDAAMAVLREACAAALARRLTDRSPATVALLAALALETTRQALDAWMEGEAPGPALDAAWARMGETAALIAPRL